MSFGVPVRNGLGIGLRASTALSTRGGASEPASAMSLNFLAGAPIDSRVTFSRGSNATLVDSTGKITYAPANLLLQSQTFDAASWSKSDATVTANATTAPDGTSTADKLAETATTAQHYLFQSAGSTATHTASIYAKAAERSWIIVTVNSSNTFFNLSSGTVGSVPGGFTAAITDAGNGWYRCSVTATLPASGPIVFSTSTGNNVTSYAGTAGSGVFIWGAQIEPVTYQTTPGTYNPTTTAAYYAPRFDYDPVTLAAKGLLIEEQRTNLVLYSEQFDNAAWTVTGATVSANVTGSPDGTSTADRLNASAGSGAHAVYTTSGMTVATGTNATSTVYVKKGTHRFVYITQTVSTNNNIVAVFDLDGGGSTATQTGAGSLSGTILSTSQTNAGNGWFRLSLTGSVTGATRFFVMGFANAATGNTISADGNATYTAAGTETFYLYGAQLEAGAFATSYIPTVASQVTRSADNASMTGTNFSSWYNQTEGTFATQVSLLNISSGHLLTAFQGYSDLMRIRPLSSIPTANITVGGVSQFDSTSQGSLGAITTNEIFSSALAYKQNDTSFAAKGVSVSTDTSVTLVAAPSRLAIGSLDNSGSGNMSGHIRSIAYYNTRLPNATLQALTT